MPKSLYFLLKYFSFTITVHFSYSETRLKRHNSFVPFQDVVNEFDSFYIVMTNHSCILLSPLPTPIK